jgi:Tol biopolymer transport system component
VSKAVLAGIIAVAFTSVSATQAQDTLLSNRGVPIEGDPFLSGDILYPPLSYDGRYIAFQSNATYLAGTEIAAPGQVFVVDRERGLIQLVSITSDGEQANAPSTYPTISGDGRFVTFTSEASNLVDGDVDGTSDVFVTNVQTGDIELVSRSAVGEPAGGSSYGYFPSISSDGRFVVFNSDSSNLAGSDSNGTWDVFLFDRNTDIVSLISRSMEGSAGNGPSMHAVISGDASTIAFHSRSDNLVEGDTNNQPDVFLVNVASGEVSLVSKNSAGEVGNGGSERASISADGNRVAFSSDASNLVEGDTNNGEDVFVLDRTNTQLIRASLSPDGREFGPLQGPVESRPMRDSKSVMSGDGRFVAFRRQATSVGAMDDEAKVEIFVRDIDGNSTEVISTFPGGETMFGNAEHHAISFDGSVVSFTLVVTPEEAEVLGRQYHLMEPLLATPPENSRSLGFVVDRSSDTLKMIPALQ